MPKITTWVKLGEESEEYNQLLANYDEKIRRARTPEGKERWRNLKNLTMEIARRARK